IYKLCKEGPIDKLSRTLYTQPALFTVEAALTDALKSRGVEPSCAAGHSLGEFGAWYAAESIGFEDGFRLVSERGRIMDSVDPDGSGAMSAVIGLTADAVGDILAQVDGMVVAANMNSQLQTVISGEKSAVEKAGDMLKEIGAKRVIPLKVSGAFHSPLMETAREEFADVVGSVGISDANVPVYANVTAEPVTDADEIRSLMVEQLTSPVRWVGTVARIVRDGYVSAFEIGPGNVIAGLVKRIDENIAVTSISDDLAVMEAAHG
ncbi:MAG: ACP S-malonyltransferase, partial [Candidatus Latescibacteria bacterium]|nr:ACP S-malonyltransferase [Candidatus Latescibacterota bacterium]